MQTVAADYITQLIDLAEDIRDRILAKEDLTLFAKQHILFRCSQVHAHLVEMIPSLEGPQGQAVETVE